jgi:Mrp family chromosome partitioning ATPase
MLRRRRRPPVLAEIPDMRDGERPGSLDRAELGALGGLLNAVRDSRAVLATGDEGKSALALGLATVAAAEGARVALVECDLTGPVLAARLGLAAAPGLHEYLRGEAEAPQILQSLVLAGPASARAAAPLVCIPAGRPASDGPTLLASEAFAHAIAKLRGAYDFLVLDGPPLEDESSLAAAASRADATLACVSGAEIPRTLPGPVTGLVVQR